MDSTGSGVLWFILFILVVSGMFSYNVPIWFKISWIAVGLTSAWILWNAKFSGSTPKTKSEKWTIILVFAVFGYMISPIAIGFLVFDWRSCFGLDPKWYKDFYG